MNALWHGLYRTQVGASSIHPPTDKIRKFLWTRCDLSSSFQACKADFCWVCLGPWEPHGSSWYNCNRYDEDEARVNRDAQEQSRSALQRYLFYCNRYMNHLQSLKFENKLYSMVKVRDLFSHLKLVKERARQMS